MRAELDAYAERHGGLTYGVTNFHSVGGAAGLRGSYDIPDMCNTELRGVSRPSDGAFQQSLY